MAERALWENIGRDVALGVEGTRYDDPGYKIDDIFMRFKKIRERRMLKKLVKMLDIKNIKNCLEIGCGTATNMITLRESGVHTFGCDISYSLLRIAKDRLTGRSLVSQLVLIDGKTLPFKEQSMGFILSVTVLCHNHDGEELNKFLDEIRLTSAKGGWLVFFEDIGSARREIPNYIRRKKEDYTNMFNTRDFELIEYRCYDEFAFRYVKRLISRFFHFINVSRFFKDIIRVPVALSVEHNYKYNWKDGLIDFVSFVISIPLSIFCAKRGDGLGVFVFKKT